MSDQRRIVPDWYNESEGSNYPFADDASFVSDVVLDRAAVLDLVIYPDPGVSPSLGSIVVGRTAVSFVFTDAAGVEIARGVKTFNDGDQRVSLVDPLGRQIGVLVLNVDTTLPFAGWPLGPHAFALPVVATCVVPVPAAVDGFLDADDNYLSGLVYLVGDAGVTVRPEPNPNPGEPAVRIDLVGDPLFKRRICVPQDRFLTPNFVKTVNGVGPNEFGEFPIVVSQHLATDPVIRIVTDKDGGTIEFKAVGTVKVRI